MTQPCLIIGAGLSGLLAARTLQQAGVTVVVFEKSRGVGGRMATRRIDKAVLDHGAQFFTVRDPSFQRLVDGWLAAGLATEWSRGFAPQDGSLEPDGHPRYRGMPGMTAVPKHLAQGLDVRLRTRIAAIIRTGQTWQVQTETGETLEGGALLLTAPVPQSLALLENARSSVPSDTWQALARLAYDPCHALLLQIDAGSQIPPPGALQLEGPDIRWVADNTQKGVSPEAFALTVHTTPAFSQKYWEASPAEVAEALLPQLTGWLGGSVLEFQVHRWRYSQPQQVYPAPFVAIPGPPPLVFAGDVFGGPRVEGAALSGLAAGERLLSLLEAG